MVCVRACVRVCVHACVRVCVRACVCVCVCVCVTEGSIIAIRCARANILNNINVHEFLACPQGLARLTAARE